MENNWKMGQTPGSIEFSNVEKLYMGPGIVCGYFIFSFESWDGSVKIFFYSYLSPKNKDVLNYDNYRILQT